MVNQTTNLHQPAERHIKKVLVARHCEGRTTWALADAVKVGDHYRVDRKLLEQIDLDVRLGNSMKRSYG